jgi:pimeloyl-ACP methyl ester carboxylesterase
MPEIRHFEVAGQRIAYRFRPGASPTLVFLPGYASDMEGAKALALDAFAERHGLAMLRLDYSGTGSSGGEFGDGTLAAWIEEVLALVDALTAGPFILVGSSMGGWIALHIALLRRERVQALVGIAAAPDFTQWGFTSRQKAELQACDRLELPNPYGPEPQIVTRGFWESGQQLRLLDQEIAIDCRVRLIHGERDDAVPLDVAFGLMRRLRSADVQLQVIKGGGHRLSEPQEIDAILGAIAALVESN